MLCTEPAVSLAGLALAAGSALFNGSFSMMGKLCKEEPDPIIFNCMLCVGIFLSSVMTIPFLPLMPHETSSEGFALGWTWLGALAGAFVVFATLFSFIAIPLAGLAIAAATWSCCAILVAFLWGAVGPHGVARAMASPTLSAAALFLLLLGTVVLNASGPIGKWLRATASTSGTSSSLSARLGVGSRSSRTVLAEEEGAAPGAAALAEGLSGETTATGVPSSISSIFMGRQLVGLLSALGVGLFGGSILVPATYVDPKLKGLPMMPSFGVGCGAVGSLVGLVYWVGIQRESLRGQKIRHALRREVLLNGLAAGFLWNASNVLQLLAMGYFCMPYGISYPILQCGLLVAGLWGIYLFREVEQQEAIAVFWFGACILMAGVVVLNLYGPGTADSTHS